MKRPSAPVRSNISARSLELSKPLGATGRLATPLLATTLPPPHGNGARTAAACAAIVSATDLPLCPQYSADMASSPATARPTLADGEACLQLLKRPPLVMVRGRS